MKERCKIIGNRRGENEGGYVTVDMWPCGSPFCFFSRNIIKTGAYMTQNFKNIYYLETPFKNMFIAAVTEIGKDSLFVFVRLGQDPKRGLKGAEKKGPPTDGPRS